MNNLRNRVNLIGNLGIDPKVTELDGGRKRVRFTLATNDFYRNTDGEKVVDTQWHNIVAWGNNAVFAEKYLKKGMEVTVEGRLTYREYEDKKGERRFMTEVVVDRMLILKGNREKTAVEA